MLCQDLRRKLTGKRPSDRYFRDASKLADEILSGGFEAIAGVPREEIMMKYENEVSVDPRYPSRTVDQTWDTIGCNDTPPSWER